jgi:hypothetical protein
MYRSAFHSVHVLFVDEVSFNILQTVQVRLREITNIFEKPFGGMNIMFCRGLRKLLQVNAQPISKQYRDSLSGAALWQSPHYFPLKRDNETE